MLVEKNEQGITGDGNSTAGRDIINHNYGTIAATEDAAPTVVEEILTYVIANVSKRENVVKGLPEKLLKATAKINKNFKKSAEKDEVKQHFTYSYVNIALIEEKYRELESNLQLDIHSHVYSVYQEMKNTKPNIEILRDLFKFFLPPGKEMNSQYVNISKAFVLFFFDDCTIFEKTKQEKAIQISLFDLDS